MRLLLQQQPRRMEHLQALAAAELELGSSSTTAVRERTHGSVYVLREDVAVSEGSKGAMSPLRSGGVSSPSSSTVVGGRRDDDDDHDQAGLIIIDHDSQRLRSQAAAIPRVYGSQSTSTAPVLLEHHPSGFLHGQEASARSPPREEASSSVPLESKGRADSPPCPAPLSPPFVVHHYPPAGSTHQPLPLATSAAAGRHSALLPQPPPSLRSFMMNNAGAAPNNTFVGGPLISPRGKRLLPPQAPASSMTSSSATIGSPAGPMASLFSLHTLQAHLLRSPLSANASPAGSPLMPPNNCGTTTTTPSIPSGGASPLPSVRENRTRDACLRSKPQPHRRYPRRPVCQRSLQSSPESPAS